MSAEITDDKGAAGLGWIGAPRRLLALALARSRQPAEREFNVDYADRTNLPGIDELARLPHHWIARVGISNSE